jgi:hypothetical protein
MGEVKQIPSNVDIHPQHGDGDDEEEFGEGSSDREAPASKDAFDITAQSAKLQLEMMTQVNAALQAEQTRNPSLYISDAMAMQAVQTYDSSINNLKGLVGDLLKISKDRDAYWQYRLDREADMRRMWEDSMAQVAREQEVLETKVGEAEEKRKLTKRALREVLEGGAIISSRPGSRGESANAQDFTNPFDKVKIDEDGKLLRRNSARSSLRRKSVLAEVGNLSDTDSGDDEEFFDAVDAGEVEVAPMMPPSSPPLSKEFEKTVTLDSEEYDISLSFKGYEDGIRKRLKMDADDRPKISLWVSRINRKLNACSNQDSEYSEIHDRKGHDQDDSSCFLQ